MVIGDLQLGVFRIQVRHVAVTLIANPALTYFSQAVAPIKLHWLELHWSGLMAVAAVDLYCLCGLKFKKLELLYLYCATI